MKNIKGKTAYVSGAASGMGFGIIGGAGAGRRAMWRWSIFAPTRWQKRKRPPAQLRRSGSRPIVSDVSDAAVLAETAREIDARFGPLHIVCNNAGVSMLGVPLEEIPLSDWDWVIDVNIKGVINGIHTFVPRLKAHGEGGHIVNTASIGGLQVNPNFRTGAYSMTKYAVVALSEALDNELAGSNIGVPCCARRGRASTFRPQPAERPGGPFERPADHFMGD